MSLQPPIDPEELPGELGVEFCRRFDILGILGQGGMGLVIRARQRDLGRDVAVKLMLSLDDEARQRFTREGQLLARLRHPNIVAVLATGEARGRPYLVFELVEGQSLRDYLNRVGVLPVRHAVETVRQVADGLSLAHEQGILHRDVKCQNIMLTAEGVPKLGDFGLALAVESRERLTRTGIFMGTPEYTPPEVIRGSSPQAASDLYALGMVLFETLTGHTSFGNLPVNQIIRAHLEQESPPLRSLRPDAPEWLEAVVERLLDKEPAYRYESAARVSAVLAQGLEGTLDPARVRKRPRPADGQGRAQPGASRSQGVLRTGGPTRLSMPEAHTLRRPVWKTLAAGAAALVTLALAGYLATRSEQTRLAVLELKLEGWRTAVHGAWRTSVPTESWLEYRDAGTAESAWRFAADRSARTTDRHGDVVTGLEPGKTYQVRVATRAGTTSLGYAVHTETQEPILDFGGSGDGSVLFRTRQPWRGSLRCGPVTLEEEGDGPVESHRFRLPREQLLLGLPGAVYVCPSGGDRELAVPLGDIPGLAERLATSVREAELRDFLSSIYEQPNRFDPSRFAPRVRAMSFMPLLERFRPLATAFFESPWVPRPLRFLVHDRLNDLAALDAAATDFRVEKLVRSAELTAPLVSLTVEKQPFEPRFHWKSDFEPKQDMAWLTEGAERYGAYLRRERRMMGDFSREVHDRARFFFRVPGEELAQARRVAIGLLIARMATRHYFQAEINGGLKLFYRSPFGWDGTALPADQTLWNEFSTEYLQPGENALELAMMTIPGVEPAAGCLVWQIQIIAR